MVMMYAPHTLYIRRESEVRDKFNRVVSKDTHWERVCRCRCDDNSETAFRDDNGAFYKPNYHVVLEGRHRIKSGTYVRCMDGEEVRGEGVAKRPKTLNLLEYSEIWILK